jgi:hypothetical protein
MLQIILQILEKNSNFTSKSLNNLSLFYWNSCDKIFGEKNVTDHAQMYYI